MDNIHYRQIKRLVLDLNFGTSRSILQPKSCSVGMMPLEKQDDADLPNIRVRKRYVNDALTIPDDAPDAPQQIVRPWPSDKPLPKVEKIFHIYLDHARLPRL